jgi:hypothetical protein
VQRRHHVLEPQLADRIGNRRAARHRSHNLRNLLLRLLADRGVRVPQVQ